MVIKVIHMALASGVILLWVFNVLRLFSPSLAAKTQKIVCSKRYFILTHTLYTLLVLAGAILLWPLLKMKIMPYWLLIKIVLFIVVVCILIKANKATDLPKQRVGGVLALISILIILALVGIKPKAMLGQPQPVSHMDSDVAPATGDNTDYDQLALETQEEASHEEDASTAEADHTHHHMEDMPMDVDNTDRQSSPKSTPSER